MPSPIAASKIRPPTAAHRQILPRAETDLRIQELLADAGAATVEAPFGYGKTCALLSFASGATRTAWVTADPYDADPARLAHVCTAALAPEASPICRAEEGAALDTLVETASSSNTPHVLIVDDAHHIPLTTLRTVLAPLVLHGRLRVVLSGRDAGLRHFAGPCTASEVQSIHAAQLRFSPDEVLDLSRRHNVHFSSMAVENLRRITDGWPAAVAAVIHTEGHRWTQDSTYLDVPISEDIAHEVLDGLDVGTRNFVERACEADVIDARIACALAGDGARLLQELFGRGTFLEDLGASPHGGPTYSWLPLFAAHVRELSRRVNFDTVAETHRQIATACAPQDPVSAVHHALLSGDPDLADEIADSWWPDILLHAEFRRMLPCHDSPADVRAVIDGALARRADLVELLRSRLRHPGEQHGESSGIQASAGSHRDDDGATAILHFLAGSSQPWVPQHAAARIAHSERAGSLASAHGWTLVELASSADRATAHLDSGDVPGARRIADDVLAHACTLGVQNSAALAPARLTRGLAAFCRHDLEGACLDLGLAMSAADSRWDIAVRAAHITMLMSLDAGDGEFVTLARRILTSYSPLLTDRRSVITAERHRESALLHAKGRPAEALAMLEGQRHPAYDKDLHLLRTQLARTMNLTGDARAHLSAARQTQPGFIPQLAAATVSVEEALLRTDVEERHEALERALTLADREECHRPLHLAGHELVPLLEDHIRRGTKHPALVAGLLHDGPSTSSRALSWDLTSRERHVLALLESPMTTAEIADALFVSVNTIKTHLRSIYRKLGATNRREAARMAAERRD